MRRLECLPHGARHAACSERFPREPPVMNIQSSFVSPKTLLFVLWTGFVTACAAFGDSEPPGPPIATLSEKVTGTLDVQVRDESPWEANHVKPRLYIKNNRSEGLSNFKA